MKLSYKEPRAEIRFLLSRDIIAASGEPVQDIYPEREQGTDFIEDPFG